MKEAFTIDQINLTARRLRELRLEKGFSSVEKVANTLSERYGAGFSKDTLGNYERICDDASTRTNAGGMPIRTVYCLSEFYGVSVEYILGLSDNRTKDTELAAVCEYTGLDEDVVDYLHECRKRNSKVVVGMLNKLLPGCAGLFDLMKERVDLEKEMAYINIMYPNADFEDLAKNFENIDESLLPDEEINEYNAAVKSIERHFDIRLDELPVARFRAYDCFNECLDEIAKIEAEHLDIKEYREEVRQSLERIERALDQYPDILNRIDQGVNSKFSSIHQEPRLKKAEI